VENEVRVLRTILPVAHLGKKPLAQAGALDRFQIILGDDHVRVDIDDRQGGSDAGERSELFHGTKHAYQEPMGWGSSLHKLARQANPSCIERMAASWTIA